MQASGPWRVYVRAYRRWRFGREEHVCEHSRRWPVQYRLNF
jgi:hypothetical protein